MKTLPLKRKREQLHQLLSKPFNDFDFVKFYNLDFNAEISPKKCWTIRTTSVQTPE